MLLRLGLALGAVAGGWAQSTPAFDAATVRVNPSHENGRQTVGPAGITYRSVTLLDCVAAAYGVREYQVVGPDWLLTERYDVMGKATGPSTREELMAMLRRLLAERFRLRSHEETKELPVYKMVARKTNPRLRDATAGATENSSAFEQGALQFRNMTMGALAEYLGRMRSTGRPVIDRTGLAGHYDFTVQLFEATDMSIADMKRAMAEASDGSAVLAAVQAQLGLKLENDRAPYRMVVVDHAEKAPVEN
jgi:uncharacterized protein (TIGR03435 family)